MMMHLGEAFLTWGISLNFLPINIITDFSTEKLRRQLNIQDRHLFCPVLRSSSSLDTSPGVLVPLPLTPRRGALGQAGHAGGWALGLAIHFCCSFLLTCLLWPGGCPPWDPFSQHLSRGATFPSHWLALGVRGGRLYSWLGPVRAGMGGGEGGVGGVETETHLVGNLVRLASFKGVFHFLYTENLFCLACLSLLLKNY